MVFSIHLGHYGCCLKRKLVMQEPFFLLFSASWQCQSKLSPKRRQAGPKSVPDVGKRSKTGKSHLDTPIHFWSFLRPTFLTSLSLSFGRYLLKALDMYWHEDCLKCGCCDCRLGEVGSTLYTKGNLLLCKRDYLRWDFSILELVRLKSLGYTKPFIPPLYEIGCRLQSM